MMSYRAIYAYAWDIAERGVAAGDPRSRGASASTRSRSPAAIMPENSSGRMGGVERSISPRTARSISGPTRHATARSSRSPTRLVRERDIFRELPTAGLAVNAWMVLLHNTRLGDSLSGGTVENAFGDRYVYSLCPSAPDAREYAVALCKDVTENYAVSGISMESPGFPPYAHGFHHEFALMKQNRWFDSCSASASARIA